MAIAKINDNHWKLPQMNGIDIIFDHSNTEENSMLTKNIHDHVLEASEYREWDLLDECYDESDDNWLADFDHQVFFNRENES